MDDAFMHNDELGTDEALLDEETEEEVEEVDLAEEEEEDDMI